MRKLLIMAALMLATGCTILGGQVDRAADGVARGVNAYCANFTADQREIFGDKVRERTQPDSILVTCE